MSSPFPSSSSASSLLSYLIPRPPPYLMVPEQYDTNGVGVPSGAGATAAAVPRPGRQWHPPLPRPPPRQCPRCRSANTKFCYYNNYSRVQPRYLCKACRRHWTDGGTLRDVPVGGGRKNKRHNKSDATAKSSTATATSATAASSTDTFPDILRQVLLQPGTSVCGGRYGIDLSAWQQMGTMVPRGGDVGAAGGTAVEVVNCGDVQYWSGWQNDMTGLDGAC